MRTGMRHAFLGSLLFIAYVLTVTVWSPGVSSAVNEQTPEPANCARLLPTVEEHLAAGCRAMGRDEVCYGNRAIKVEYTDSGQTPLAKEGDIAPLNKIKSLSAGPLNPDLGEWGVAVIKTQPSNLEGVAAGQVVTFIVYGNTTINGRTAPVGKTEDTSLSPCTATTNRVSVLRTNPGPNEAQLLLLRPGTQITLTGRNVGSQWLYTETQGQKGWLFGQSLKLDCDPSTLTVRDPQIETLPNVNAFYFSTGIGARSSCKDIPPAGVFVQSPKGQKVTFRLNGADIIMGSTAVFSQNPGPPPTISVWVIEGEVSVVIRGVQYQIPAGTALTFPQGGADGLQLIGRPGALMPMAAADPSAPGYVLTLCKVAEAAGLTVGGCIIAPVASQTRTPLPQEEAACTTRTFLPGGRVCIPGQGIFACDRNGRCDDPKNGETGFTCPEDCGAPPPPEGWGSQPTPSPTYYMG
jgi:hypothetical protein